MRIMYVEDNPANISLLQRIARMGGHEVINYTDGELALTRFKADNPDLVLMDLQLEGRIGGLEVVRELRAQGFTTPIVAVTAYAMVGDRERCLDAGCDGYLSKPLPVGDVVELVHKYEVIVKSKDVVAPDTVTQTVEIPSPSLTPVAPTSAAAAPAPATSAATPTPEPVAPIAPAAPTVPAANGATSSQTKDDASTTK
jgi:two-component system cell cycle response regulator DivK